MARTAPLRMGQLTLHRKSPDRNPIPSNAAEEWRYLRYFERGKLCFTIVVAIKAKMHAMTCEDVYTKSAYCTNSKLFHKSTYSSACLELTLQDASCDVETILPSSTKFLAQNFGLELACIRKPRIASAARHVHASDASI